MRLFKFAIVKITLALIFGIITDEYLNISVSQCLMITSVLFGIILMANQLNYNQFKKNYLINTLILLLVFSMGLLTVHTHEEKKFKTHYSNFISPIDSEYSVKFRVREVLKPNKYNSKYIIDVFEIDQQKTTGKCLLNIKLDSISKPLLVDNIYAAKTKISAIQPPLNPHQFDYKNYLAKSHVHHQLFISTSDLWLHSTKTHTAFGFASKLRNHIIKKLEVHGFSKNELAIIKALLMGQRQDITEEVYSSYAEAGAVHILAVSGLHVGIILILLNIVFKPLNYLKNGRLLKLVVIVVLLWTYAVIAGLSASVVRAVTMFTAVAIAMHLKRPTNIFNTLALSIFILLIFKPTFIYEVGFQLSYLAVLAIVIFQPMLEKLWNPKHKLITFFWKIFTVTIAAQLGIIPVSLFYFHQFPGLFFVSNLVIIPFLGFLLGLGIIVIILSVSNILPTFVADFYGNIIGLMNDFVSWISQQESFLFQQISFDLTQVLTYYMILILVVNVIKSKTYKALVFLFAGIIILQSGFFILKIKAPKNAFVVFHKNRHSIIGIKKNSALEVYSTLKEPDVCTFLENYKVGEAIDSLSCSEIKNVFSFKDKQMLVVDSLGVYNIKGLKLNYVLLRNSPKINLNRLIDSIKPEVIISDGSSYKTYQNRWAKTCEQKSIPFHQTSKKGAFIVKY